MLEVFCEGDSIEIWSISSTSGRRAMQCRYRLTVTPYLQGYSPLLHRGEPRGLAQLLDQDCNDVINVPLSQWHDYTFEQAAQYFPDACDTLVDTQCITGMQRPQIRLRLYLSARRQLLELLLRIKKEIKKEIASSSAEPPTPPPPGDI